MHWSLRAKGLLGLTLKSFDRYWEVTRIERLKRWPHYEKGPRHPQHSASLLSRASAAKLTSTQLLHHQLHSDLCRGPRPSLAVDLFALRMLGPFSGKAPVVAVSSPSYGQPLLRFDVKIKCYIRFNGSPFPQIFRHAFVGYHHHPPPLLVMLWIRANPRPLLFLRTPPYLLGDNRVTENPGNGPSLCYI